MFISFTTKAIHLELAIDLSTEAFLACLKRYFARRGLAKSVHSDNGTYFVGANSTLKQLFKEVDSITKDDEIQNYLTEKGDSWYFIPSRAPHFGGLWEAAVKSFKTHFTRVAGNSLLTCD